MQIMFTVCMGHSLSNNVVVLAVCFQCTEHGSKIVHKLSLVRFLSHGILERIAPW